MIRLTTLENRFETDIITDALEKEGIGFLVRPFRDSAYDGIYETQKGYALLLVEEEDEQRAKGIVDDVRASVSELPVEEENEEENEEEE